MNQLRRELYISPRQWLTGAVGFFLIMFAITAINTWFTIPLMVSSAKTEWRNDLKEAIYLHSLYPHPTSAGRSEVTSLSEQLTRMERRLIHIDREEEAQKK